MRRTRVLRMVAGVNLVRLLALVLVSAVVLAATWLWVSGEDAVHAEVVGSSSPSAWKTLEYRGVQVDIPASWELLDMDDCEFQFEVWGPPEMDGCDWAGGVAFYGSATFDPAHGPGVKRGESRDEPDWGGYAYAGAFAVYVSDDDRTVVQQVLRSAR